MNKEEAVILVNEFGALTVHDSLYGNHFSVTESELLAFANACEKIGMEKAAKICSSVEYEFKPGYECAEAIRAHKE